MELMKPCFNYSTASSFHHPIHPSQCTKVESTHRNDNTAPVEWCIHPTKPYMSRTAMYRVHDTLICSLILNNSFDQSYFTFPCSNYLFPLSFHAPFPQPALPKFLSTASRQSILSFLFSSPATNISYSQLKKTPPIWDPCRFYMYLVYGEEAITLASERGSLLPQIVHLQKKLSKGNRFGICGCPRQFCCQFHRHIEQL